MTEAQKSEGLLILDLGRTLSVMSSEARRKLLDSSVTQCTATIATVGRESDVRKILEVELKDYPVTIYDRARKESVEFYEAVADLNRVPLDRCILVDDDLEYVAAATNAGVHALYFTEKDDSFFCLRHLNGPLDDPNSYGNPTEPLEAIRQITSEWGPERPATDASITQIKSEPPVK